MKVIKTQFFLIKSNKTCQKGIWDYYEIGVHFFEKNKGIVKKGNCANNFQYRLNLKKNLKVSYCQESNFFQPKLARKDEKR